MFFCFRSTNRTGRWFRQQFTTSVRWDGWDKRRHKLCRINTILRGLITKCTAIKLYSGCTVAWGGLQLPYLRTFIVQHPLFLWLFYVYADESCGTCCSFIHSGLRKAVQLFTEPHTRITANEVCFSHARCTTRGLFTQLLKDIHTSSLSNYIVFTM